MIGQGAAARPYRSQDQDRGWRWDRGPGRRTDTTLIRFIGLLTVVYAGGDGAALGHRDMIDIDPSEDGLRVTDHIESAQFELHASGPVEPENGAGIKDAFRMPVDRAVRIETDDLRVPSVSEVIVRDADGRQLAKGRSGIELPPDAYDIGIWSMPAKTYLAVEGPVSVTAAGSEIRIGFDGCREVLVGVRSRHDSPAGTVTTPPDPESVMRAVSSLGSSLKTTSPERSFPTLRGHPPLIEVGDRFDRPAAAEPPDTGIELRLPATHRHAFAAATVAHYLGATVRPGEPARVIGDGWTFRLGPDVKAALSRVLRQNFFLDCLVRTEGLYRVDLRERKRFERELDVDLPLAELYDRPIGERVREYLSVPFKAIEPHLPEWELTTDVQPEPDNAAVLPYLAAELSLIRCPDGGTPASASGPETVTDLLRSADAEGRESADPGEVTRAVDGGAVMRGSVAGAEPEFVRPEPVDTTEHAWVGDGIPLGANKATLEAYERRVDREPAEQSHISVAVVCNDDRMRGEGDVADLYGLRDMLQFDVDVRYDLRRAAVRELLESETDFLHYVGHVDERGMQCADGFLDLTGEELDVGVEAFLLNACESYRQGQALVEMGSRAGIVTLTEVSNSPATRLGRIIARLLNGGFNLRTALSVAQRASITGYQYLVLGDGGVTLCQSDTGVVSLVEVDDLEDGFDRQNATIEVFPNGSFGVGSLYTPNIDGCEEHCTVPSRLRLHRLTRDQLADFLGLEVLPVFDGAELYWSDELLPI